MCSVHLPATEAELFIYGLIDPTVCQTASQILNFDLVHEVVVESTSVETTSQSWGSIKTRF